MESPDHLVLSEPPLTASSRPNSHPLVAIVGPTGAGKSQLALALAQTFDGEIINCDSIQVYRGLDIGSAKISFADRGGIPHHLLDVVEVVDVDQDMTAGAYARQARTALQEVQHRNKLPIVVGGTGLYMKALLDGLSPAPLRNQILRNRLRKLAQKRPIALHRFLRRFDPAAAARIHPNDHQKLIRAVELTCSTGAPASAVQNLPREALRGYRRLKIGLAPPRVELYRLLNERTLKMFSNGLLDETAALLKAGAPPDSKPLQSLGYKQAVAVLAGEQPLKQAIAECQTRTRQYAKRQLTWFRADDSVQWLDGFGSEAAIQTQARDFVTAWQNAVATMKS